LQTPRSEVAYSHGSSPGIQIVLVEFTRFMTSGPERMLQRRASLSPAGPADCSWHYLALAVLVVITEMFVKVEGIQQGKCHLFRITVYTWTSSCWCTQL
jgi:hypothetical protein